MDVKSRLQWVVENHPRPDGGKWSRKSLSLAAGKAQSHAGQIIRGDVEADVETLEAFARAAGVSAAWLVFGTGAPVPDHTSEVPSGGALRFGDLPAWPLLRDAAVGLRPNTPAWVWEKLAALSPLLPGDVSVGQVAEVADIVLRYGAPPTAR